jgi:hypothetical protein
MSSQENLTDDPEAVAIAKVSAALKDLDPEVRNRVLKYVAERFGISTPVTKARNDERMQPTSMPMTENPQNQDDELDGISPAGKKWIARNGIDPDKLMSIFSLGIDEIDLVSKSVPGEKKTQRLRNVFLLKGIAAYLGTGAARFTHEEVKETCLHYNAWDGPNFAVTFKSMSADVSGTKDSGYSLTSKGISEATSLVKGMISG